MIADGAVADQRRPHRRRRSAGRGRGRRCPAPTSSAGPATSCCPGLVNAHQHLTGDRLIRSAIPDDITSHEAIFSWAVPIHAAHTPDDDELSATLALVEAVGNGITFTVEAGTVAHPDRVLAAFDRGRRRRHAGLVGLGRRRRPVVGVGRRGARPPAPRRSTLTAGHPRVDGWVTLVGHDLMSDELVVGGRASSPRRTATGLTFHLSPTPADAVAYLARTGRRPVVHLDAPRRARPARAARPRRPPRRRGGRRSSLERDVAIAYCPWAYLRLGQGVTRAGRHAEIAAPRADGSPSAATARTPATPSTSCAARRWPPAWPGTRPGSDPLRGPRRAGAGDDRRRPGDRDGPRDRLAGGRQAGRRRRRRRHRSGLDAPVARPRAPARVGERRPGRPPRRRLRRGRRARRARARRSTSTRSPSWPVERQRHLLGAAGLDPQPRWPLIR